MHRTTVEFDDKTLQTLKAICRKDKKTFKKVVLDVVRKGLEVQKQKPKLRPNPLEGWVTFGGPLPEGFDPADRSTYEHLLFRPLP